MKPFHTLVVTTAVFCVLSFCQDNPKEASPQVDVIDTHKGLSDILPSEANLPEGVIIKPLPENEGLPCGLDANPYISEDPVIIDAFSEGMFSKEFSKGEVTSVLFVVYDNKKRMGINGCEFDTKKNAERAYLTLQENMNHRAYEDKISLIQIDKLVLMVWTDENIQNKNYQALLKLIKTANKIE